MNHKIPLLFMTKEEWRKWLEKNHNKETGIRVIHYKKGSIQKGLRYREALEEALCFGWIDGKLNRIDNERFSLTYTPRTSRSFWSQLNKEKVLKLIQEGRMTKAGLAKIAEAKKNGMWEKAYTNKKRDRMPSDLKKALLANKIAYSNFKKFANSYKNMYIGWIIAAKRSETRKKRIQEVLRNSKQNKKLI